MRCTRWLCNRRGMRRDNGRISLGHILYVAGRRPIRYMTLLPLYLMLSSLRDDYNIHVSLDIHQTQNRHRPVPITPVGVLETCLHCRDAIAMMYQVRYRTCTRRYLEMSKANRRTACPAHCWCTGQRPHTQSAKQRHISGEAFAR